MKEEGWAMGGRDRKREGIREEEMRRRDKEEDQLYEKESGREVEKGEESRDKKNCKNV